MTCNKSSFGLVRNSTKDCCKKIITIKPSDTDTNNSEDIVETVYTPWPMYAGGNFQVPWIGPDPPVYVSFFNYIPLDKNVKFNRVRLIRIIKEPLRISFDVSVGIYRLNDPTNLGKPETYGDSTLISKGTLNINIAESPSLLDITMPETTLYKDQVYFVGLYNDGFDEILFIASTPSIPFSAGSPPSGYERLASTGFTVLSSFANTPGLPNTLPVETPGGNFPNKILIVPTITFFYV